jgi:hypothetical protein
MQLVLLVAVCCMLAVLAVIVARLQSWCCPGWGLLGRTVGALMMGWGCRQVGGLTHGCSCSFVLLCCGLALAREVCSCSNV